MRFIGPAVASCLMQATGSTLAISLRAVLRRQRQSGIMRQPTAVTIAAMLAIGTNKWGRNGAPPLYQSIPANSEDTVLENTGGNSENTIQNMARQWRAGRRRCGASTRKGKKTFARSFRRSPEPPPSRLCVLLAPGPRQCPPSFTPPNLP